MNFTLKKPCIDCPYRKDRLGNFGWLGGERAREIAESLYDYVFPCHKTVKHDDDGERIQSNEVACYGALVLMKKENILENNRLIRYARFFKMISPEYQINENIPIVDSFIDFEELHAGNSRAVFAKTRLISMSDVDKANLIKTYNVE